MIINGIAGVFWFCSSSPTGMFLTIDLLLEYWIEHVTVGLL